MVIKKVQAESIILRTETKINLINQGEIDQGMITSTKSVVIGIAPPILKEIIDIKGGLDLDHGLMRR